MRGRGSHEADQGTNTNFCSDRQGGHECVSAVCAGKADGGWIKRSSNRRRCRRVACRNNYCTKERVVQPPSRP